MNKSTPHLLFLCIAAALLSTGCGRDETVHTYREVTTLLPEVSQPLANAALDRGDSGAVPTPTSARGMTLEWDAPEGWGEEAGAGMRRVTLRLPGGGGDCSITTIGGQAGGARANVRRWAGQLSVELSETELDAFLASAQDLQTRGGLAGTFYDFTSLRDAWTQDAMFATILVTGGQTVFVKLMAPAADLAANREGFLELCQSLRFSK